MGCDILYHIKSPFEKGLEIQAYFGSLNELFKDTIRLNTKRSSVVSFSSTQK